MKNLLLNSGSNLEPRVSPVPVFFLITSYRFQTIEMATSEVTFLQFTSVFLYIFLISFIFFYIFRHSGVPGCSASSSPEPPIHMVRGKIASLFKTISNQEGRGGG